MADLRGKPLLTVDLSRETDFVLARRRAAEIGALLDMERQEQTRIATAVSEISRNAFVYTGSGRAEFYVDRTPRLALRVVIRDKGAGIPHLQDIWSGTYRSASGMGLGLLGSKRIVDGFDIQTGPQGTVVTLIEYAGRYTQRAPSEDVLARKLAEAGRLEPATMLADQNQELLQLLEQLRSREVELERLNKELEETNRGVMVLYSELEDKAQAVQQANDMKTRFLSSVTHELRTPLNSILSLSRLLMTHEDGDLTGEQERQVGYILRSAQTMTEMVNDLLDLAKIEAGKVTLKLSTVSVAEVFSALRGMFRPLALNDRVELRFEMPEENLRLQTDEGKLGQILRNFISNGLKFTPAGSVTVRATRERNTILFSVTDTGIGIAPENHELVLQEWAQVEGSAPKGQRGSGLGLPLAKKFTELLGGEMGFTSEPGKGSTFYARLPIGELDKPAPPAQELVAAVRGTVLVVDDDEVWRYLLCRNLESMTSARVLEAKNGRQGLQTIRAERPGVVVLDIVMPEMSGLELARAVRQDADLRDTEMVVITSKELSPQEKQELAAMSIIALIKKDEANEEREVVLERSLLQAGLSNLHEAGHDA